MLLSGSVYSWGDIPATEAAKKLEIIGVDCFHVDCNDDPSVFDDINAIKKESHVPIDLHLITPDPQPYFEKIRESGTEICCIQYEYLDTPLEVPDNLNCRLGLAICMDTPVEVFEPFSDRFAFILLMTTTPGQSGGSFNEKVFQRIREFRNRYPNKSIHVDGGVTDEVSLMLKNHGVRLVVVGSFLERADSIIKSTLLIRGESAEKSNHLVRDFMQYPEEFPVLSQSEASVVAVLKDMSSRRSSFAAIIDDKERLVGVVTDGDLRRAWLRSLETGEEAHLESILNGSPKVVHDSDTVATMLEKVSNFERACLFLPVINNDGKLRGAVSFQDLIKGEL